jgi:hypothetical protein
MNKKLLVLFTLLLILASAFVARAQTSFNSSAEINYTEESAIPGASSSEGTFAGTTTCTLNGENVPCEELAKSFKNFLGWGIGGILLCFAFFLFITIFWIMMLVHAIKYPIEHKPIWILILLITGILGAIVYYFAVKKNYNNIPPMASGSTTPPPQTPPSTP